MPPEKIPLRHSRELGWTQNPRLIFTRVFRIIKKIHQQHPDLHVGFANQRSTFTLFDRVTGQTVLPFISWRSRIADEYLGAELSRHTTLGESIQQTTGLIPEGGYPGFKIKFLLEKNPILTRKVNRGDLVFATVDTYLHFHLSGGKRLLTDVTNASRTLFFDINTLRWNPNLVEFFKLKIQALPRIATFPAATYPVPDLPGCAIVAGIGDQQADFLGTGIERPSEVKITIGTGGFVGALLNTNKNASTRLCVTPLYTQNRGIRYGMEGVVLSAGAALEFGAQKYGAQFNRLGIRDWDKTFPYFLPALTGIGAPFWQPGRANLFHPQPDTFSSRKIATGILVGIVFRIATIIAELPIKPRVGFLSGGAALPFIRQSLLCFVPEIYYRKSTQWQTARGVLQFLRQESSIEKYQKVTDKSPLPHRIIHTHFTNWKSTFALTKQ